MDQENQNNQNATFTRYKMDDIWLLGFHRISECEAEKRPFNISTPVAQLRHLCKYK
jgi:hypothetical protein